MSLKQRANRTVVAGLLDRRDAEDGIRRRDVAPVLGELLAQHVVERRALPVHTWRRG